MRAVCDDADVGTLSGCACRPTTCSSCARSRLQSGPGVLRRCPMACRRSRLCVCCTGDGPRREACSAVCVHAALQCHQTHRTLRPLTQTSHVVRSWRVFAHLRARAGANFTNMTKASGCRFGKAGFSKAFAVMFVCTCLPPEAPLNNDCPAQPWCRCVADRDSNTGRGTSAQAPHEAPLPL